MLLLLMAGNPNSPTDPPKGPGATYRTSRSIPQLEKCLTESLSKRGDVTAIKMPDSTTLMYRETTQTPMLIDLEPPSVTVTTRFAYGTRRLVEACL
jgi:hypothetical protein